MGASENLSVAKIVGSSDERIWVQVHTFFPEDKDKLKKRGNLLAVLTLKEMEEEGVEAVEVGREVIARLHEEYYGNIEGSAFERLKKAVEKVKEEVEIEILAGVIIEKKEAQVLYLVTGGEGKVMVKREEDLGEVLKGKKEGVEIASGYLKEGDMVVLGNKGFFKIISGGVLKGFLGAGSVEEIVDELAPMIHGRKGGIGAAAVVCQLRERKQVVGIEEGKEREKEEKTEASGKKGVKFRFLRGLLFLIERIEKILEKLLSFLSKKGGIYIRGEKQRKAKRTIMTVAVLMIGLLLLSIFFGLRRKEALESKKSWEEFRIYAEEKLEQVEALADLNPVRAKEVLAEVREELGVWRAKVEGEQKVQEVELLVERVEDLQRQTSRKWEVESADVFLDLNLIRKNTQGRRMGLYKNQLVVLDEKSEVILGVDIAKKQGKILGGRLGKVEFTSVFLSKAFYPEKNKIFWIDLSNGVASRAGEISEEVGRVDDFVAYAGNVYVLDGGEGQVWKFPGIEGGLGGPREYLAKPMSELSSGISMAIDGSIWVMTKEGLIYKFTQQRRERFVMRELEDDFGEPVALYTDDDCEKLYILDKGKTRVVVVDKDGKYEGQYVWPGIAGVDDLVVSEDQGKILLLSESKLFEIKLQ